jgi:hypothetical protein
MGDIGNRGDAGILVAEAQRGGLIFEKSRGR